MSNDDIFKKYIKSLEKCLIYIKGEYIYHDKLCLFDIQWQDELKLINKKSQTEIPME